MTVNLSPSAILDVATELAERRINKTKGPSLPPELTPTGFSDAFAIARQVSAQYCQMASTQVIGWKCAMPNGAKTIIGHLFANEVQSAPKVPLIPTNGQALIEPELCFTLGQDLPPRKTPYSHEEIDTVIGSTRLALELIYSRYQAPAEQSFHSALADGLLNQGIWLGPDIIPAQDETYAEFDLTITTADAGKQVYQAKHQDGHARAGLYWLVNFLSRQGIGLSKGQHVITGSYAGVLALPFNQKVQFQYGSLGEFEVEFVESH
ncbi:hydratase [Motilimonas eburnea]|uniref:hydratase n=1 Tax=Motilimonas eburnea TaxID=1737488 RepID=UPI001E308DDC|nr:hydratase [Motilimonas eburnea]MCE2572780.1 hydratase [Motilimonas eburnea]